MRKRSSTEKQAQIDGQISQLRDRLFKDGSEEGFSRLQTTVDVLENFDGLGSRRSRLKKTDANSVNTSQTN